MNNTLIELHVHIFPGQLIEVLIIEVYLLFQEEDVHLSREHALSYSY